MTLNIREKEKYYRDEDRHRKIKKVVLNNAKEEGHTVHGAKALNKHVPHFLDRRTEDWDIFSTTPKDTAQKIERKLDRKFGGDFFRTEPAQHPGTTKVVSNVTHRTTADYTETPNNIKSVKRDGINYATLGFLKGRAIATVKDPTRAFRKDKDREAIQRINLSIRIKRREKTSVPQTRSFLEELFPPVKINGRLF